MTLILMLATLAVLDVDRSDDSSKGTSQMERSTARNFKRKKTGMILIKKKAAARRGTSDSGKGIILHALSVPQREENVKEVKV